MRADHPATGRRSLLVAVALATLMVLAPSPAARAQTSGLQAAFEFTPAAPQAGETVSFTSTTTGGDASTELAWDLDGDGAYDDATGPVATRSFPAAGEYTVALRARRFTTAGPPIESAVERAVTVAPATAPTPTPTPTPAPPPAGPANQPPTAVLDRGCTGAPSVTLCPGQLPRQYEPKTFDASGSSDPDGRVVRYEWDLDGDGTFEHDSGGTPTATRAYDRDGSVTVRVRVTDDDGATAVGELRVIVLAPSCRPSVTAGALRATARCFRRHPVDGAVEYRATSRVALNGMIITPATGRALVIRVPERGAPGGVRIKSLGATVTVMARGETVKLLNGRFAWELDGSNRLRNLRVGSAARLGGLRITGFATQPQLRSDGSSELRFYLAMPAKFGGPTSDAPIRITPGRAVASAGQPLEFTVRNAAIGPIGLKQLRVRYDGNGLWEIDTSIGLPEPIPYTVSGAAGVRNGDFEYAQAGIEFGTPGIGPFGPVFLQRIKFRVEIKPRRSECVPRVGVQTIDWHAMLRAAGVTPPADLPRYSYVDHGVPTFALCGEVGLTGGPQVLGAAAVRANAGFGLATYDDRPSVFRLHGRVYLVEIPLAQAGFELHTDGYMRGYAKLRYAIPDLASLEGYLSFEMLKARFNAEARVKACLDLVSLCAGARALVSSRGMAVCLAIDVIFDTWSPGFGMRWGRVPTPYFSGCDVGPYRERITRRLSGRVLAQTAGTAHEIALPSGLPGAVIVAEGRDAPPKISVIGPNGERVTTPDSDAAVQQAPFLLLKSPSARITQVAIGKPAAGRWRVVVEDGSSPVVSIRSAEGLERPQVDARVSGKGHRRVLRYRIKPLPGQQVTFVERGPSTGGRIGNGRGARGRLRFTPADGKAERREIVAIVEQDGMVREQLTVARYRAPRALRPAAPRRLHVKRRGSRLRIGWTRVAHAEQYEVSARLSNGRRLVLRTRGNVATVRRAPAGVRGKVTVRALSAASVAGAAAQARVPGRRR